MAHFAAWFCVGLAIEVDGVSGFGDVGDAQDIIADKVLHDDVRMPAAVTQGPAGDGADVLFELADGAAVLRPMAGVVDARGDFIDDQPLRRDEEFDTEHADIVERIKDLRGQKDGIGALG